MKAIQKASLASLLLVALTSGAYAQVTQDEFNKLKEALFSEEAAVDRDTNQPIVDENGDGVFKGVIPALVNNVVPALADKIKSNEDKIDIVSRVQDQVITNINGLTTEVNQKTQESKAAFEGLTKILFSTENAVDQNGSPVTDEAGNTIKAGLITALNDQVENNTKKINAVNDVQDEVIDNINNLANQVNENSQDIVDAYNDLDAKKAEKSEIERLDQSIAVTDDNVATLFDKTNANEDKISALDARQAENRTALLALADTTVKSFEELDNAKADKKEIDAVYDSIAITDDNVQELYDVTNEHEAALLALDEKQAANAANIEILTDVKADKEYVDNNLTNIINHVNNTTNVIGQEVGKVKDATNTNKAAIANLDGRVEIAEQAIRTGLATINASNAQLERRVTNNSARIDQLDKRVNKLDKKLERGLASQAALSGLFQPYNVGKVNVTAAVGGYKSKTAVAVGAGYRFNDKVAAKAGVSFSTGGGSASYNVGINYEF